MMTFALATALILTAAWLAVQAIAATIDGKTDRILNALRGIPQSEPLAVSVRVSQRYAPRSVRVTRPQPQWRAAA